MAYRTTISGLTPGTYGFRFKTADDTGRFGDWSPVFQYTVTGDITPPPATSKPVVESVMGGVYVKWVESAYNAPVDFNRVDVYVSTGGAYTKFGSIATIGAGITYTPATGTGPFTFKFTGVDRSGNVSAFSEASDAVSAGSLSIDTEPPAIPGGLSVTAGNDSTDPSGDSGYVDVTWTASASTDLLGYYIRYGRSATVWDEYVFMEKGQLTKRIYGLRSGTTYYFQINATDGSNPSAYIPATPISVTVPADTSAPAAPTGLVAVAGFNNVIAYWNRNTEKDVDLGRGTYEFQISTSSTFASILQTRTITGTVATFTGLTTEQIYYVRVRAIDSSGNTGAWSTVASATPGKISGSASITNGTIVGDLVAANTIVGDKLVANTIDADRLKTNTGIVGKLYVGDEAATNKVVIDGTAAIPAFYQGTGTYNSTSTGFYLDGAGKFSLKDKLTWDTSTLTVRGSLNVTQASTFTGNVTLSSGGDILLNGGAIRATGSAGRVEIGSLGVFGYNAVTGGTPQVRIDAGTGQITAIGGSIGGWQLASGSLTTTNSSGQQVGLFSNGQIKLGNNFNVSAAGDVTISGVFTVVGTGSNVATTTDLAGKVSSGDVKNHLGGTNVTTISGGIINTGTINLNNVNVNNGTGNSTIRLSSSGLEIYNSVGTRTVYLNPSGAAEFTGSIKSGSTITGTAFDNGSGVFKVTDAGVLTATSATITGSITATDGYVGGFTLTTATDLTARTADRPRILFGNKIAIGWDDDYSYSQNYYGIRIGNSYTTSNARFVVNTKDDVFRASIDTTRTSYAMEVAIALRAYQLRYSTSSGYGLVGESSSRRFKENISYLPKNFYERVLSLSPATWTYKYNVDGLAPEMGGMHGMGLIAEDLEEAGLGYFVERDMEGRATNLQNMVEFATLLVPVIKDLKNEVSSLNARIVELENNV